MRRQYVQTNTRLEFSAANQSHHAVVGAGRNPNVPSLISPYTASSVISCTDCHNSNSGPRAGGTGPNGPHGSVYTPLLERQLLLTDDSAESATNYALCYKCHSQDQHPRQPELQEPQQARGGRAHRLHHLPRSARGRPASPT